MKNNKLFFLVLIAFAGCSKKVPHTLAERWEKKHKPSEISFLQRKLASSSQNACMKDAFTSDVLKEEVIELENKYPKSQSISGSWKHLDLSTLPVPQANFLKQFGNKIGDLGNADSIDYSSCQDVPCIINKVYGTPDSVAGYVHYIWFLRTNQYLAANNLVPREKELPNSSRVDPEGSKAPGEYNGKQFPMESFLFKESELYGFWRLSHMIKSPHTTLDKLREIHRIPRGEKFIAPALVQSCGLAYSQGWILLTDGCLWFEDKNPDKGWFYQAVAHELSHQVDFQEGRGSQKFYRSHRQDYLDITGLFEEEYIDDKGVLVKKWKLKDNARIISDYGKNSPQESFAEDLAMFRVEAQKARSNITTEHFNFVSQNYYQSQSFENEYLIQNWIKQNTAETERAVLKVVMDCNTNSTGVRSAYFSSSELGGQILPSELYCYGRGGEEISQLIRAKVLMEEAEGCNILKESTLKNSWNSEVKKLLVRSFQKYLDELRKDKDYLARIQNFYANVEDTTIATNSYLECYGDSEEESCFNSQIKKVAEAEAQSLKLPPDMTTDMSEMYVSHHSFSNTKDRTIKFYQNLVRSNSEMLSEDAASLWNGCASQTPDDSQSPHGKNFQIGNGYMISSQYNCLNENIQEAVKGFVRNINVEGFKIQHPKEEVLLIKLALPEMTTGLKAIYEENRTKEKKESVEYAFSDEGKIRSTLLSDLSWVRRGQRDREVQDACFKMSLKQISYRPRYHLKNELFSEFIKTEVCSNLEETKEFKDLRAKEDLIQKLLDRSEMKLTEQAALRAKQCLDKFPMGNIFNKIRYRLSRESCLEDNWSELENKVVSEMMQDPGVETTKLKEIEFRERLDSVRKKVQKDAIKSYFPIF